MKYLNLILLVIGLLGARAWADNAPVAVLGIGAPAIPAGLPPTGAASGDLTGTYPSPTVTAARFASPGAIGSTSASTGAFTTLTTTGNPTFGNGSALLNLVVNGAAATSRDFRLQTAGSLRWFFGADSTAEGGSDAGSNFFLTARTDAGANIDSPILINRVSGGTMTLSRPVVFGSATDASATNTASVVLTGGIGTAKSAFIGGDLVIAVAGKQMKIKEGTNAAMGSSVLVGGTVVVSDTLVTANTRIFLTSQVDGGTPGFLRVSTRTAGTSFTILSSSGTDTSTVAWRLIEPAP